MTTANTQDLAASGSQTGIPASFLYVNTGPGWPSARLDGLVIGDDGGLALASLPGNAQPVGPELPAADAAAAGIAGIAVDREGNIYLVAPGSDLIYRVDACDGKSAPLLCIGGRGSDPGRLSGPRGLAVGPQGWLYVADSGNHRVQVVDLGTLQLRAVYGQPDPTAPPRPGDAPGRFNDPQGIAIDAEGNLYVADHGNQRVQKLDAHGRAQPAFWETMRAQPTVPQQPAALAMMQAGPGEVLLVVDAAGGTVLAYRTDGAFDPDATALWAPAGNGITAVLASGGLLYAGDASGRIHVVTAQGVYRGAVQPFKDPGAIAGMAADCHGGLLVRQLSGAVQRLEPAAAYLRCGTFLAGPLTVGSLPVNWQRVAASAGPLPEGSTVQLFTLSSSGLDGASPATTPGAPVSCSGASLQPAVAPGAGMVVPLDSWRAAPANDLDFLALNQPGRYLWIAGILQSPGDSTPRLAQVRVEFNHESWMRYLPAMYRRGDASPSFANPAMLLLESMLADLEGDIDALPRLFDAAAAPDVDAPGSWLDWLANWLAVELQENWPEERRRDTIARAFAAHGKRGTVESLKELVRLYAGVAVRITEPALTMSIWSLGETSTLGDDTMLASAHPDGAIAGNTSTLGQSHLIQESDYGAPLFDTIAHRFCVSAYAVDVPDQAALERVRAVLDREKPAHTVYELCTVGALMRVGVQATIGIDTIIGDVSGAFVPGEEGLLGFASVLPPLPPGAPAMVGRSTGLRRELRVV